MSALYDRSPLRFKLPEFNGGVITENDMFPGMNYYENPQSLVLVDGSFSSVFSSRFNTYSTAIAPRLVRYIPSLQAFYSVFYKGLYIYNPSIEEDGMLFDTRRVDILFSITGGSVFTLPGSERPSDLYFEGSYYEKDLNDPGSRTGIRNTSVNGNINVSIALAPGKNIPLDYFEVTGSSRSGNVKSRNYTTANSGISIPSLSPGDYQGVYMKFESLFNIKSNPKDYCFFNMSYTNIDNENFGGRDRYPGASSPSLLGKRYYVQSYALKFTTNFSSFKKLHGDTINRVYDNYPPFFTDYRDSENVTP